jgi:inhibitor of cysteine peptidase
MKNLIIMCVISLICSAFVLAYAQGSDPQSVSNPDHPIDVSAGQEFKIVLDSNPTTGFEWQLASPLDETLVTLVGNAYTAASTPGQTGAGGKHTWTFKAVRQGHTVIALKYLRSWEKGVAPLKNVIFTLIIR